MRSSTIAIIICVLLIHGVFSEPFLENILQNLQNYNLSLTSDVMEKSDLVLPMQDRAMQTARKKKKSKSSSVLILLLTGALFIKSVVFPVVFKVMVFMAGIAVILSIMSLITSSLIGYAKLAANSSTVKVVYKHPQNWAKDDENVMKNYYAYQTIDYDPNLNNIKPNGEFIKPF